MRVLVTGGAGFIGSHVVDSLLMRGHEICVLDNLSTGKLENLTLPSGTIKCRYILEDVEFVNVRNAITSFKAECVVHLAAQSAISSSIQDPVNDMEVNGIGTLETVQAALHYGVKRFVLASTSAVYKHTGYWPAYHIGRNGESSFGVKIRENDVTGPDTPYGISKLAAEGYVRTLFPNSVILRFGNVIGPRQVPIGENQVLSRMIRHFKYGDKFFINGSGEQKRDFVNVWDVALAILQSLEGPEGTYNIASGEAHSVNEMAKIVEDRYGVTGYKWEHTDIEDPRTYVCLDISVAERDLNWQPNFSFEQTINETIDWWNSL